MTIRMTATSLTVEHEKFSAYQWSREDVADWLKFHLFGIPRQRIVVAE